MEGNESSIKLLTVKDLSQESGIPVSTIYKLVEAEKIPFVRLGNKRGKVYFRKKQIVTWLGDKENEPRETPELGL